MKTNFNSMLWRALCVVILLVINAARLQAQRDKLYLRNGSVFVGQLQSYKPGDSIVFLLRNNQQITLSENTVKKIEMGENKREKKYEFRERGFYNATYFGVNVGKTNSTYGTSSRLLGVSLENITGFQFNRFIGAGLGVGISDYYTNYSDMNVVSVFSEVRGYMSKHVTTGYYSVITGFGMPLKSKNDKNLGLSGFRGGLLFQPAIGLRLSASPRMNFFVDVGARFQRIYFNQINDWTENYFTITTQRWVLRGGIMF